MLTTIVTDIGGLDGVLAAVAESPELVVVLQATFADASLVGRVADRLDAPLVVWSFPEARTGERLRLNSLCGANLAAYLLRRRGAKAIFASRNSSRGWDPGVDGVGPTTCDGNALGTCYSELLHGISAFRPVGSCTETKSVLCSDFLNQYIATPGEVQTALAETLDSTITLDIDAAGWGWNVTPGDTNPGRIDLMSVLLHEIGHVLGYEHTSGGLMAETLEPGAVLWSDAGRIVEAIRPRSQPAARLPSRSPLPPRRRRSISARS